jgi:hypothetical protein
MSIEEGRAVVARPSLCLCLLLLAGAFLALMAASATPAFAASKPILIETVPASPGASLTPRVRGDADGIVTSVVHTRGLGPVGRDLEPGTTITIYTDENCIGPVAATGTPGELEGSGILVSEPVLPDSKTTFYAAATDSVSTSGCSNGVTYQQVTTPPPAPTLTSVSPASGSNQNVPHLIGSAAPNTVVVIYADPTCSGVVVASGSAAGFSSGGIQVQVGDNTTTTFYARATLAGIPSECSPSSLTYQEVSPPGEGGEEPPSNGPGIPPPVPRLRTVPGGIANDRTPIVTGTAPQASLVKIYGGGNCKGALLAKVPAPQFLTGVPLEIVPNTTVAFAARSVDVDGDESACSQPVLFTEDSIAPRTRITAGPGLRTMKRTAVFRFADVTGGLDTRFLCKVDRRRWRTCHTPLRLRHLGHKRHILRVRAYDAAGNHEKRGVKRRFQVVRTLTH